jgi:hypothetical protein
VRKVPRIGRKILIEKMNLLIQKDLDAAKDNNIKDLAARCRRVAYLNLLNELRVPGSLTLIDIP